MNKSLNNWLLIDTNSNDLMQFGEDVEFPNGLRFELIGGTRPTQARPLGTIVIRNSIGVPCTFPPDAVSLKWKEILTEDDLCEYLGLAWVDHIDDLIQGNQDAV